MNYSQNKPVTGKLGKSFLQNFAYEFEQHFTKNIVPYRQQAEAISETATVLFDRLATMAHGGKRLRAALVNLGYQVAISQHTKKNNSPDSKTQKSSIETDHTLQMIGMFVEVFHTGLLIHDDIMDGDDIRRGAASLHKQFSEIGTNNTHKQPVQYGTAMAIGAGDLAFYLSWQMILESKADPEKTLAIAQKYSQCATRLVYGQAMDITHNTLTNTNQETVLTTIKYKTAEYTGVFPLEIGAILGGASTKNLNILKQYGLALGWAFQVQDDILGIFGTEEKLGKPIGSDIREGKPTLLMIALHELGTPAMKKRQLSLLQKEHILKEDVMEMQSLLIESGALDAVTEQGHAYVKQAIAYAQSLDSNEETKAILTSLASYMMERTV